MKSLLVAAFFALACASPDGAVELAAGQSPTSLATDGKSVVWTNARGDVMRVSVDGGPTERVAFADAPGGVVIASGDVLFTTSDGVWKNDARFAFSRGAHAIATTASRVFWTTSETAGPLMTCALDSCSPSELAGGDASFAIAVDDTSVYWSDWNAIWTCPLDGCDAARKPLAAVAGPAPLTVDSSRVYWTIAGDVLACDKRDCTIPAVIATRQAGASAIASDGEHVYWVTSTTLVRADSTGPTELAALDSPGVALALDGKNVYVATRDRVMKIAKN